MSSSSTTTTRASISLRAPTVYSVDDAGVEHEAPERHESEFARALEADFKRRALAQPATTKIKTTMIMMMMMMMMIITTLMVMRRKQPTVLGTRMRRRSSGTKSIRI
jgi:hypothetical protein